MVVEMREEAEFSIAAIRRVMMTAEMSTDESPTNTAQDASLALNAARVGLNTTRQGLWGMERGQETANQHEKGCSSPEIAAGAIKPGKAVSLSSQ